MKGEMLMPTDAGFEISLRKDGVYLRISPACPCSLSDVVGALKEKGITDYDGEIVRRGVEEKLGVSLRVAAPHTADSKDADFRIRVSDDSLTCEVWLIPPVGAGAMPTPEQIKGFMHSHGVVYGHNDEAIKNMIQTPIIKEWVTAASGEPPVNGKDAAIDYRVDLNVLRPRAVGDNVDMRELGTVINVLQGQEIAEKTPAAAGSEGMSVLGKKIPAYVGKDVSLPGGKGTTVSDDKMHLFADFDGSLKLQDGKITILPCFDVTGDVDYSVGNIDFVGPVSIHGSVREGFDVSSGSDIVIDGVVEGASVSSKGNLIAKVGVRGTGKAKISVGGDMTAGYIDQAYVRCDGNIEVTEAILHSDVGARGEISALGSKKGQIAGGKAQAGFEVACEVLGSEMGTRTEVIVGIPPELAEERKRRVEIIRELGEKLTSIDTNVEFLKTLQQKGALNEEKRVLLAKITKAKFQLRAQFDASEKRLAEIETEMEKGKAEGCVRVRNICHPGVNITIRGVRYLVREELRFTRFVYEDGEIRLKSFN